MHREATKSFNQRTELRDAEEMYLKRFETAREMGSDRRHLKQIAKGVARSRQRAKELHYKGCIKTLIADSIALKAQKQAYKANQVLLNNLQSEDDLQTVKDSQANTQKYMDDISSNIYGDSPDCEGIYWRKPVAEAELSEAANFSLIVSPEIIRESKSNYHQSGIGKRAWYYRVDIRNISEVDLEIKKITLQERRDRKWQPAEGMNEIPVEKIKELFLEEDLKQDLLLRANTSASSFLNYYLLSENPPTKLSWEVTLADQEGNEIVKREELVLVKD